MRKLILAGFVLSSALWLTGCIAVGGGSKHSVQEATLGQQLIDLQRAKEAGAISDAEYQAQKTKLLQRQQNY